MEIRKMRLSKWSHVFEREGTIAILNSLTMDVAYLGKSDYALLVSAIGDSSPIDPSLSTVLREQGMMVEDSADEDVALRSLRDRLKSELTVDLLYLLLTDACNLRCRYCFEDAPDRSENFRPQQMTDETIVRSIDLFAAVTSRFGNHDKRKIIHLYGGEPLLNKAGVRRSIETVRSLKTNGGLPTDVAMTIVTNGTKVTQEDAALFAENGVTVGLSLDGPPDITDLYRIRRKSGVPVSELVAKAFDILKKNGVKVGLSVTMTPEAIERFDEFLEFFTKGRFGAADGISLNLLHYTPHVRFPDDYYTKALACQIKAFQRFREIGMYEERVMRKARAFADQQPIYADCGIVGNQLVIAPDGLVGVCQDYVKPRKYFPCSVYEPVDHAVLIESLFAGWRDRSPFYMGQCHGCFALGICGGGCPASAEQKTGLATNIDERACFHSKQILEWLIWDAYAQSCANP